jgi:hypothetical protein
MIRFRAEMLMRYAWTVLIVGMLFGGCFGGDDDGAGTATSTASASPAATEVCSKAPASPTASAAASGAAACQTPRELTTDEQQPSLDEASAQGLVLDIDADTSTITVGPTGPPPSKPVSPVPQLQVRLTEDTQFLFSDGTQASLSNITCGAEIAVAGTHELRGRVVAELVGLIVPRAKPPAATSCPIAADACSFASQMARVVLGGDGEAAMSLAEATLYECPGASNGTGPPFPICNDVPAGETRAGFPSTWGFGYKGGAIAEASLARIIKDWHARADSSLSDTFGDGAPRAYTIACVDVRANEGSKCRDEFSLIFSGLVTGSSSGELLRSMLVVYVHRDEGELRAYRFESSGFATGDWSYALEGGTGLVIARGMPWLFAPSLTSPSAAEATLVTFFPWEPLTLGQ